MKEFNILPTNPDFQALTSDQVGFIMANMKKDAEIRELLAKGYDPEEHIKDTDESWWNEPLEDFNPKGLLDIPDEEIAKQVEALTSEEDRRKLAGIIEGSEDWADYMENEGNENEQATTESVIQENLRKAQEEAQRLTSAGQDNWGKVSISEEEKEKSEEFEPMTQESVEEAYRIFEGEEEFDENHAGEDGPDTGWI